MKKKLEIYVGLGMGSTLHVREQSNEIVIALCDGVRCIRHEALRPIYAPSYRRNGSALCIWPRAVQLSQCEAEQLLNV